ncbi:MAG: TIGR03118 family protein [Mycobacteriales bacterium]
MQRRLRTTVRAGLLCLTLTATGAVTAETGATPASADSHGAAFAANVLFSDQTQGVNDPNVVNAWGLSIGPTTALWVADNGTDVSTIHRGGGSAGAPAVVPLVVSVPTGAPTGTVFSGGSAFVIPADGQPARFLFDTEHGDVSAWNGALTPNTAAVTVFHSPTAVYKGLALASTPFGPALLAANFHDNSIDILDGQFNETPAPAPLFRDPFLPRGYAPFNVQTLGTHVYVAYAKQDADRTDEVAGRGRGFVDEYTTTGLLVRRVASRGPLNAPWGLAIAPSTFGPFAGALLVGNFGDGTINAYGPHGFMGTLRGADHRPLVVDGLWALQAGNATAGGADSLWFSAGPEDESHGQVGLLQPAS